MSSKGHVLKASSPICGITGGGVCGAGGAVNGKNLAYWTAALKGAGLIY